VAKDLIFDFDRGSFDTLDELVTLCTMNGMIETKGSYLCIPDTEVKEQGRENFKNFLVENPHYAHALFQNAMGYTIEDYFKVGVHKMAAKKEFLTVDDWIVYLKDKGWVLDETGYVPMNYDLQKEPLENWILPGIDKRYTIISAVVLQKALDANKKVIVTCSCCKKRFIQRTFLGYSGDIRCINCPKSKLKTSNVLRQNVTVALNLDIISSIDSKAKEAGVPRSTILRDIIEEWRNKQND
jgi:Ribbon-helix-helix protein, copG family.